MAKFCKDIICGKRYLFITQQNELVCQTQNLTEVLLPDCCDFDATDEGGCVYIAATDKSGNLVYIINNNGHWGRGIAAKEVMSENIFICRNQDKIEVYYICNFGLYKRCFDDNAINPVLVDEILYCSMPFVCENKVYYISKNEKLCTNDKTEICDGKNITHIFATSKYLCVKDGDRLELISACEVTDKKSLTRRHSRSAQCPLYVCNGDVETLCWHDGNQVLFSQKEDEKWCGLETITVQNAERLGVYKFDGKYDLGCLKDGKVCSFNIKA